jgi:uncharacterized small protein (DUF1192 family)
MLPEQRRRYDAWRSARQPGSQDQRVGAKLRQAFGAVRSLSAFDLSVEELQARIAELKAEKRAWEVHCAGEQRLGVFG